MWQVKLFWGNDLAGVESAINNWFKEHPKIREIDPYQSVTADSIAITIFYRE
jgi:hypothetical protein